MDLGGLPFEILSDIYESYLSRKLTLNEPAEEVEYMAEAGLRKGRGIYYTPRYIVRYIVDQTLGRYLWGLEGKLPARTPEEIRDLCILDPACGSGSFLSYIFDVLAEFYTSRSSGSQIDRVSTILENHIYGIDLDGDAVDITRAILTLKALEYSGHAPAKINVRKGNFLVSHAPFPRCDGGFAMILGNPPYGARLTYAEREQIRSDYKTRRSSDSSSLFVEKSVRMLREKGILGFVVPKSLSYVVSWYPIREFLLNECRIAEIADAREAFRDVLLEQIVIIAQKRGRPGARTVVSILRPEGSIVSHSVDRSALTAKRFSIWLGNRRIRDIVDRAWEKSVPLGQLAGIWNGFNIQRMPVFSDICDSEYNQPCLRGKDIQRYHIRRDMQYIKVTESVKRQCPPLDTFCRPKIVVQDIVAHIQNPTPHIKLAAAIDRSESWVNVNTVTNITSSAYCLEYLCGILNSRLISWYTHNFIYNRAERTMHFRTGYADHIPIRRIKLDEPYDRLVYEQLIEYVRDMIALCGEGIFAEEIARLDEGIEKLIYQLYGITDDDARFLREHAGLY